MSLFFLTRTVSLNKRISVPVDDVLRTLHDSQAIINLNPLVEDVAPDAADPNLYHVTDILSVLGLRIPTKYTTKFQLVEDGFDSRTEAGLKTSLNDCWRARAVEGGTEVTEVVTIKAFFLVMPFVAGNLEQSHQDLLNQLAAKLESSD
ncbi:hypothetical protein BKA93DRAFT_734515 [Sparassis latifolia]